MDTLLKDIPFESIPASLGGGFTSYNESFVFDMSVDGPLFCANEGADAGIDTVEATVT